MAVVKRTPVGKVPVIDNVDVGEPTVLTVKVNALATLGDVDAVEVNAGNRPTVIVNDCVVAPAEFVAVSVTGKLRPAMAVVAVPTNVAVPPALAVKVMPVGKLPLLVMAADGDPVVATTNENGTPVRAVAVVALVKAGRVVTVIVTCWVCVDEPLTEVMVRG